MKEFKQQNYKPSSGGFPNPLVTLVQYFRLRFSQLGILFSLLNRFLGVLILSIKDNLIIRMYWGRTSFYKTFFHALVIIITASSVYGGLGPRLIVTQRESIGNVSVSNKNYSDSDIVFQQGSLFPINEINADSDSLYTEYTVKSEDTLSGIAERSSISTDTIRWANGIPKGRDTLKVGQVIKIPKANGVLYTVKSGDTVESILKKVKLNNPEADEFTFRELNSSAFNSSGALIAGSTVLLYEASINEVVQPVNRPVPRVTPGPKFVPSQPVTGGGGFVNPMQQSGGYYQSRGYSYGHTGVDLATSSGAWVVAAGNGQILKAGWCFSLGYCVQIRHDNGYQSIYGHGNGVLSVSAGQRVGAGQRIMQAGCTGRCYGTHVHLSMTTGSDVLSCYRCRVNPAGIIPY